MYLTRSAHLVDHQHKAIVLSMWYSTLLQGTKHGSNICRHLHHKALKCAVTTALQDEFGHARLSQGRQREARKRERNVCQIVLFISDHETADCSDYNAILLLFNTQV